MLSIYLHAHHLHAEYLSSWQLKANMGEKDGGAGNTWAVVTACNLVTLDGLPADGLLVVASQVVLSQFEVDSFD